MRRILLSLLLALALFAGLDRSARADILLVTFRIDGLPGDPAVLAALYPATQGWMPAFSAAVAGGRIETTASASSVTPLLITKPRSNASPGLAEAAASRRPFASAVIELRSASPQGLTPYFPLYRILLTGVTVRRFQMASATLSSGSSSSEEVELDYTRIEWQYWTSATTMVSHIGWDVANRKVF
jgi:type VI secretion system Hcp family effector